MEQGNVPGEWYSPTQPFVTKPPPFDRQGVSPDDVIEFTPELHAEAVACLDATAVKQRREPFAHRRHVVETAALCLGAGGVEESDRGVTPSSD